MNKIRKFFNLSSKDKRLFAEAVYLLFYYKLFLSCTSFKKISQQFKRDNLSDKTADRALLSHIRRAIYRADKLAIWKNRCLICSLAARKMIEKRGINSTLHLAVRYVDKKTFIDQKTFVIEQNIKQHSTDQPGEGETDQQRLVEEYKFIKRQKMEAHAWLTVGDFYVTRGSNETFKEIFQI